MIVPVEYIVENYFKTMMCGQGRSYILQPIYRIIKLFERRTEQLIILLAFSIGAFVFSLIALYMTVAGFNFLFVVSVLSMMELFIIIGAYSANTFSGKICAQRAVSGLLFCCLHQWLQPQQYTKQQVRLILVCSLDIRKVMAFL